MLSVRIVCTNHYMSSPVAGLDVQYSEFRGTEVKQVPVIQIFGATISGQKTCLHVHGVFPYIYIPYEGSGSHSRLMYQIASSLDKALNISFGNASSSTQHVYKVMLVSGRPFYGFHVRNHQYFKIYFYNPLVVKRAVELLQNGAILNKIYQPHEAHIPYILQFMIDYNLYGMSYIKVGHVMYRRDSKHTEALSNILEEHILPERINRISTCELEADCVAADILNRTAITDEIAVNPGLAAIWEDEKQRRREEARTSQITPQSSQQRPERAGTTGESYYMEKLFSKLAAIELQDVSDSDLSLKISPEEERVPYPAETPEDCDLKEASYLDLHVHGSNSSSILTERAVTTVVDEDVVLSLSASYKEVPVPSDTSIILNSQDMQLVEILEDMENGVEDDSILGSQQIEFANQNTENAEDEGSFLDLRQPLEQLCNTEDINTTASPLSNVKSEEVWDNTFWNEMEGNIPQLDGADDTPIKACRKRLGVRGKIKQQCEIKGVKIGNEDINLNTKLDHIEEDVLNDKSPVIESSDIRSSNQDLKIAQVQEAVLNGKSPAVPYSSLSIDTCTPEVIVIESDDDNFQNKEEIKQTDPPMLEEIPPDSDGLSAELFTDDFESFPLQENGDQENNFQNETSNSYSQELTNNASVEDYAESNGRSSFYIASDTSMPFKNVLIGDPSFTAQPCSSDGDELIVEVSMGNVSWTGSNVSKSWVTSDKSLEVDIGSPLLVPYDSGGVQEISPEKVPHIDNSKIVEQPNQDTARRGRRRGTSLPKCSKSAQERKTTANPRSRRSTRNKTMPVDSSEDPSDPNTSDLNLFSTDTVSAVSDLSLIVDNTTDILNVSAVLLPSCSIGSPSDEVKRIETLLRQGDIEEIMETSCDNVDETLHRLKCNHSTHREYQEKEIIEIVIDDSSTSQNDTNIYTAAKNLEEQRKLDQLPTAEIENVDSDIIICKEVMQEILNTVEILSLDINSYNCTFTDCVERSRTCVEAEDACSSDTTKKIMAKKSGVENQSFGNIAENGDDKNNELRSEVISPSLDLSPRNNQGCKDDLIKNNISFPAEDDVGKEQSVVNESNEASSSQLLKTTHKSISKSQISANNIEPNPQILAQNTAPSKSLGIKTPTNKLESELLAQETSNINAEVPDEEPASSLQAQLLSLQTSSLSPRKLRSSLSSETYSRKLARKREKKKEKPNKLSLSSKKKTSVTDDLSTSDNEYVNNGLQRIIGSPSVHLNKLSADFGRSKDHKLKSDRGTAVTELDVELKYEDYNRNLRDSTKKASIISARRSIRNLLDMEHLKNNTVDKNQENNKTDVNQNQNSDANTVEDGNTRLGANNIEYSAARVKRKSASTGSSRKRKCNQKTNSTVNKHLNIAENDKQFGSSVIDSIVSCKENIIDIDNIPVTGNTTVSTYLPSQHDELLNPKTSALNIGIESKPLKSKQFRKRLKEELLPASVSKADMEMHSIDKGINLALEEVPISSSNKQNNGSYKKHKTMQVPKFPKNVSQVCCKVVPAVLEPNMIQPCFIKLEKLKESVIQKFCHRRKSHSSKTKIKNNMITIETNDCEQNVTSVRNGKSNDKKATSLQKSVIELNKNSQKNIKVEKINEKEKTLQKSVIELNKNSQQNIKAEKINEKETNLQKSVIELNKNSQKNIKAEKINEKEKNLQKSVIELNKNSQKNIKAEKINEKEKKQKQLRRNSNIGAELTIPHSSGQPKTKIKNTIAIETNGSEQNVTSIRSGKSNDKKAASLQKSVVELNKNSQQNMKAQKINEKENSLQKSVIQLNKNSQQNVKAEKLNEKENNLQKSVIEFNKNSQKSIKAEKINEKEKKQKQLCRNSNIGAELTIPHSSGQSKSKKRKLSENNNVQIHRVAYETKEFGTVKVPKEALAALKRVKLSISCLKESPQGAKNQFKIKKIPILDGSADTSSSDDSVESNTKKPKKHTVTSQTLAIVRLSKQKKQENSNKANKIAKARGSKDQKSGSTGTPKKARPKAVNLSQASRESAYNPLDIVIKRSPKKSVKNRKTVSQNRRSSATFMIDSQSVESALGCEGVSDIGAKQGINPKDEQKSASVLVGDILRSNLNDSRTVDQSSLHSTTTTSLKFISPLAAKGDIEHWSGDCQLNPHNPTTNSISNSSSNVDNNSVNQSASMFWEKNESEVCDSVKECRFSAGTSRSTVFVNMDSASTSYSQNFRTRLDNNLSDSKSARKRLQFSKPEQFSNKTIMVPEIENSKTNKSGSSIPVHRSIHREVNVHKVVHKFSQCSDKGIPKSKLQTEENNEAHKGIPNDTIIKHSAQPHEAFEYLEKMEHEDSDDDQDHGILSFYEVGLKSPDNMNETTILSTDSDNDCQSSNGKPEEEKCEEGLKVFDNINSAMTPFADIGASKPKDEKHEEGLNGSNSINDEMVTFTDINNDSESSSDRSVKKFEETLNSHNSVGQVKIYIPLLKAPTKESIFLTLSELGIPEYIAQEPFVSDTNDTTKKKHIGNRTLQLCSNSVAELKDFTGGNQNTRGVEFWRNKLFHGFGPMSQMSADQVSADLNLKASLASQRKTIITPSFLPPSVKEVELWLKAKELLQQKTDAQKLQSEEKKEKKVKTKVIMPLSPGQESLSDNEDVLSVISCSPLTPKENFCERSASLAYHSTPQLLSGKLPSPHCTPISKTVKYSGLLLKGVISASRNNSLRSPQAKERSCNSPNLPTIVEDNEEPRTASNMSLSPTEASLDSTLKLDTTSAEREDRLPVLENCCEEQSASKVIHHSQYRKLLTTPKHLKQNSGCQIEGSTPDNSHGFKMSLENLQDARAVSEHQYLTLLAMELHIQTRGDLRPDPTIDPIRTLFYFVANDVPEDFSLPKENKGLIVVGDSIHPDVLKWTASCYNVCYVPDEKSLFSELVNLIRKWDPDILIGYEVEMLSWGYLFQRAFTLQINLCPQVSRIPGGKSNNQNPDSNNSQSLDFSHDIRLPGRMVLNVWRLMRHEIALQSYTFENVMYHVLHQRIPLHSFKQLTLWWDHKTHLYRWICVDYYMLRVEGMYRILQQLDLIERTSELARLFGIQFYEVLSRGSQFRVESMMLRLAKPLNYVPVSPSVRQRAEMRAPEALPLIMEPSSGFYTDPLIVLDFQSLYPSIIIAYNYCFSTCLGRVEQLGQNEAFKFGCTHLKVSPAHLLKLKNDLNFSPAGVAFVKERIKKGILPRMLQEILDTRLMVKKSMKEHKDNKILQRVLHSRQLGLKLIANVTYGYTAANFSGRMPCIEVGDSVVSKGRETLHRAISLVKNTAKWNAEVVYGDTDSLFVLVPGRTREQAFKIGAEIAEAVTMDNPKPVKLKLEKVYQPCILQTKKRYVGYMYETPDQEKPVYEAKGIETVRRDGCPAVAKILEKSLKILFDTRDVSLVKKYVCRQFDKLIQGRINTQDLTFAKEYRGMKGYQPGVCIPALELTRRWLQADKRAEPRVSERVPYVITAGPPSLPLIQLVRSPYELLQDPSLRINVTYYITRALIPPLQRCFSLVGADVDFWYASMPRKAVTYLPAVVPEGLKKSTISHYFATTNCAVCDKQTHSGICSACEENPQSLAVTLEDKLRQWERAYFNITKVCQSCCGRNESVECSSLDCPVLFRRNRALRDLDQSPFVRSILQQYLSF